MSTLKLPNDTINAIAQHHLKNMKNDIADKIQRHKNGEKIPLLAVSGVQKMISMQQRLQDMAKVGNEQLNEIDIVTFASKYYRWLRGDPVPAHLLQSSGLSEQEYSLRLFTDWCKDVGKATSPVWVVSETGEKIYLFPPIHTSDSVEVYDIDGYVHKDENGEIKLQRMSSGVITENMHTINNAQNPIIAQNILNELIESTINVNGADPSNISKLQSDFQQAIAFFDKAFGIEQSPVKEEQEPAKKQEKGYASNLGDYFD